MIPPRRRRPLASRVASGGRPLVSLLVPLLATAVLAAACSTEAPPSPPSAPTPDAAVPVVGEGLVIVLPPADLLAEEEREHVRRSVGRAIEAALPDVVDAGAVTVLEPADASVTVDALERAVRLVGPGGTVCVVGAGGRERIAPVLALYPAARFCLLPVARADEGPEQTLDVDLGDLGRRLGTAARTVAGPGTVLLLDAGDPMLDRRWRDGVASAVVDTDRAGMPTRFHSVRSAEALLRLLDDQAALLADGLVPGSPEALAARDEPEVPGGRDDDDLPPEVFLPPVNVVVLDGSRDAELVLEALAEREMPVVGPRSLLVAASVPQHTVVLRWHVDWHLPLTALLDAVIAGESPALTREEPFVIVPGPAAGG